MVIDHYESDWSQLWYLLVQGRAELLEPCREQADAIAHLRSKYVQYRDMALDDNPIIKITPERATAGLGDDCHSPAILTLSVAAPRMRQVPPPAR